MVNAVLGDESLAQFSGVLQALQSPNNAERKTAEQCYEACKVAAPDATAEKLCACLGRLEDPGQRLYAAVVLKRLLVTDVMVLDAATGESKYVSGWKKLAPATLHGVKESLLAAILSESDANVRRRIGDAIGEAGGEMVEKDETTNVAAWPELIPYLLQMAAPANANQGARQSAMAIFATLMEQVDESSIKEWFGALHDCFYAGLDAGHTPLLEVRKEALRASSALITQLEEPKEAVRFSDLCPAMLSTLGAALEGGDEDAATKALMCFSSLAEYQPKFLRKYLEQLVEAMLAIAGNEGLGDEPRHSAIEVMVALAENRMGMMRKLNNFVERLFPCCLRLMLDIDDEPEDLAAWAAVDDDGGDENSPNLDYGQEALDRLATALGGKKTFPVAVQIIPGYLASRDWKHQHAALVCLSMIAEGCKKQMEPMLDQTLKQVADILRNPASHPRVRWACCNVFGQFSTDFSPELQEDHADIVVPALYQSLHDFQNPRVQAHAASALINFSDGVEAENLKKHLEPLLQALMGVISQTQRRITRETALTALASIADAADETFQPYYIHCMPTLKQLLGQAVGDTSEMQTLRAKAMECISLVGMAVGRELFENDARDIMQQLQAIQQAAEAKKASLNGKAPAADDEDQTMSYLLQAWARMCKSLGETFLPYMGMVMPPLLASASQRADQAVVEAGDRGDDDEDDDNDVVDLGGGRYLTINTTTLEEKATACNMLCCYASELKGGFAPYVQSVAPILVPLVHFYLDEEVRKAAAQSVPELLASAKDAGVRGMAGFDDRYLIGLANFSLFDGIPKPANEEVDPETGAGKGGLVNALGKERDVEVATIMLESLAESLDTAGHLLTADQLTKVCQTLFKQVEFSASRTKERLERKEDEDYDEEEDEMVNEEMRSEEEVIDQITEVCGAMARSAKATFLPVFDNSKLFPYLHGALSSSNKAQQRSAVMAFDDIIENCGAEAVKYFNDVVPVLLMGSADMEDSGMRQCCVYGLGVCAAVGGALFAPAVPAALQALQTCVGHKDSLKRDNRAATDNAVSAVGKIAEHCSMACNASDVLGQWLAFLPLKTDREEARVVHEQLCRLLENENMRAALLGADGSRLPKVLAVFASACTAGSKRARQGLHEEREGGELVSDDTRARMAALVKQAPPEAAQAAMAALGPEEQATLAQLMHA